MMDPISPADRLNSLFGLLTGGAATPQAEPVRPPPPPPGDPQMDAFLAAKREAARRPPPPPPAALNAMPPSYRYIQP